MPRKGHVPVSNGCGSFGLKVYYFINLTPISKGMLVKV